MEDRVKLAVGETKEIILDSNPTTGYSWSIIRSDGLEVIEEFILDDTNGPVCGAGGKQHYRLSAKCPGEYEFMATYRRSWENDAIETFSLKIDVK